MNYRENPTMAQHLKPKPDDKAQSKRFLDTAREIGADEESSAADGLLGRLAKQAPEPRKSEKK